MLVVLCIAHTMVGEVGTMECEEEDSIEIVVEETPSIEEMQQELDREYGEDCEQSPR